MASFNWISTFCTEDRRILLSTGWSLGYRDPNTAAWRPSITWVCRKITRSFLLLYEMKSPAKGSPCWASLAFAAAGANGGGGALVGKRRQGEVGGSLHCLLARGVEAVVSRGCNSGRGRALQWPCSRHCFESSDYFQVKLKIF
jgi:hypothetical protein